MAAIFKMIAEIEEAWNAWNVKKNNQKVQQFCYDMTLSASKYG